MPTESGSTPSPAVPSKPAASGEIRIKTLEEIRQEKAAKAQASGDSPSNPPKNATAEKPLAKKQQGPLKRKVRVVSETTDTQQGKETPEAAPVSTPVNKPPAPTPASGEVRVKTLEEIRREKAARLGAQAQSSRAASNPSSSSGSEEGDAPNKRRILRISKTPSPGKPYSHSSCLAVSESLVVIFEVYTQKLSDHWLIALIPFHQHHHLMSKCRNQLSCLRSLKMVTR